MVQKQCLIVHDDENQKFGDVLLQVGDRTCLQISCLSYCKSLYGIFYARGAVKVYIETIFHVKLVRRGIVLASRV